MISKLHKKFIFINMLLVSIVLLFSFGFILSSTYRQLHENTTKELRYELEKGLSAPSDVPTHQIKPPEKKEIPSNVNPRKSYSFHVDLSKSNQVINVSNEDVTITEEDLDSLIKTYIDENSSKGTLYSWKLRYATKTFEKGTRVAFYDLSSDIETMKSLGKSCLLVGILSLLAFFLISVFLANWALKPVQKSWSQQKHFIADASHELKTPLTVILANLDILSAHEQDTIKEQKKWLQYMKEEALHMNSLIQDMLFLAKSDAGKLAPVLSQINLSDVVWNTYLPYESLAYEQNLELTNDIDSDIYIEGDGDKLKQLMEILFDNANKYSEQNGHIFVSLKKKGNAIQLLVRNSGTVIPSEYLPQIFERFYRVDTARSNENGSFGLGLSIAKSIVELHHGKISVTSNAAEGTTFTILFAQK